jgi:Flp pilus assembly protein TadG
MKATFREICGLPTLSGPRNPNHHERGAAAVEMALVLPLLVVLAFGTVECGRYYSATIVLSHASREAVRKVAIANSGSPSAAATAAAAPYTPTLVTSAVPCVAGTNATATLTLPFTYNIPLIGQGTKSIVKTAVMRCGG